LATSGIFDFSMHHLWTKLRIQDVDLHEATSRLTELLFQHRQNISTDFTTQADSKVDRQYV